LLSKDAWKDKAPHKLINEHLDQEAENKRIVYLGMKPKALEQDEAPNGASSKETGVTKLIMDVNSGGFSMPKNKENVKDY